MLQKFLAIVIIFTVALQAQTEQKISARLRNAVAANNSPALTVVITFTAKPADLAAAQNNPPSIVSQKSLDRRRKVLPESQLIDFTDLPVSREYITAIETKGAKVRHILKWFNSVSVEIQPENVNKIAAFSFVKKMDLLSKYTVQTGKASANPLKLPYQPQGTLQYDYGDSYPQVNQIRVPQLHNMGYKGQGVIIAVLDAGFNNLAHESFSQMQIIAKYDFVNHDPGVGDSTDLGSGSHGTATLSAIGGFKEGKLIGPAFEAKYILCKTENTASETPVEEDNWIAAIQWADSIGADISSTSLGYLGFDDPYTDYTWQSMNGNTCRITIAADLAAKKGIAVFNSAGNEGYNADHNTLNSPADGDSVITVGAVDNTGVRVGFSSVGNTIDGRIKPDIMAMGLNVTLASPGGPSVYYQGAGTSFSCPIAAGAAALLLCARPNLTPIQLKNALVSTANNSSSPNREYGWGIINVESALGSLPLPVELTSFQVINSGNGFIISWTTASEKDNRGFYLETSDDNSYWEVLNFIAGKGSSSTATNYSFTDNSVYQGTKRFYRLGQVDFNGKTTYTHSIEAVMPPSDFTLEQNYPNPFNPQTVIQYTNPVESKITLKVFDVLGNEVLTLVDAVQNPGRHSVTLDAGKLASGVYCYVLEGQNRRLSKRMMLLK